MNRNLIAIVAASIAFSGVHAGATVTSTEADRLGKDLTPVGAERAGNKDGTIPAWTGRESAPAGWSQGKQRISKFNDEKPLFSIDAGNVDKYADKLTSGQIAVIKQNKKYRMDIYPTHRNCGVPEWVEEKTKQNAMEAKLADNGWGLAHAKAGGVPFPIPKNGVEAMWNHKLRIAGTGFAYNKGASLISPRQGTNQWIALNWELATVFPGGRKEAVNAEDNGAVEFYQYWKFLSPAAMAGQAMVAPNYLNKESEISYYFPGQRRVRRMPTYTYDTPQLGFENQYTVDQNDMFWSALDRFDYKLTGKKEIYIAHNASKMFNFNEKREAVYHDDQVNPDARRYELHRVWVVEATVKPGVRHTFPKRLYYLDEDSWNNVLGEDYDANGKPWKVREAYQMPMWEIGGTCNYGPLTQYDLQENRYVADYVVVGQGVDLKFYTDFSDPRFKASFYTPESLRAISER